MVGVRCYMRKVFCRSCHGSPLYHFFRHSFAPECYKREALGHVIAPPYVPAFGYMVAAQCYMREALGHIVALLYVLAFGHRVAARCYMREAVAHVGSPL